LINNGKGSQQHIINYNFLLKVAREMWDGEEKKEQQELGSFYILLDYFLFLKAGIQTIYYR